MRCRVPVDHRPRTPLVNERSEEAPGIAALLVSLTESLSRAHVKGHEFLEILALGGLDREVLPNVLPELRRRLQRSMMPEQAKENDEVIVHPGTNVALRYEPLGDGALVEEAHCILRVPQRELPAQ